MSNGRLIRWCKDIGMFAFDLPIAKTCRYRTKFCNDTCYNNKFYRMYHHSMPTGDAALWAFWQSVTAEQFVSLIRRKRKPINRFRFCTRGDIFYSKESIDKVAEILKLLPGTLFWIPTRAWRKDPIREYIERTIMPLPNARLQASIDPSNTVMEIAAISRWPKMFYGDDSAKHMGTKCPKTWEGKKAECASCEVGCFNNFNVHLKQH